MAIESIPGGGTIITGKRDIHLVHMLAQRAAFRLELAGMRRRGRTVYAIVKEEYGLRGNRRRVFEQFCKMVDEASARREQEDAGHDAP
jgi:hypothetical protein